MGKLECMPWLFHLLCLSKIDLSYSTIREIPETIKGLMLRSPYIKNCKSLKFLPELPLTQEVLHASGCVSLEMVSSTKKAFSQKFWDDYTTNTFEDRRDGDGSWHCLFYNCRKLDQNGRQTTNIEFQLRVLSLAARNVLPGGMIFNSSVQACYPGNEIPNWFDNQFEGSSIIIKLSQQWHDTKFLGFVVCAVGDSSIAHPAVPFLSCKVNFLCTDGENREFSWMFSDRQEPIVQALPPAFNPDHVYMWYWPMDYSICLDAVEVTFEFAFLESDDSAEEEDDDFTKSTKWEVKRCGIHMLYEKDLDEFFNNHEHLLEPPPKKGKKTKHYWSD